MTLVPLAKSIFRRNKATPSHDVLLAAAVFISYPAHRLVAKVSRIHHIGLLHHGNLHVNRSEGAGGTVKPLLPPVEDIVCPQRKRAASAPPTRLPSILSPRPTPRATSSRWHGGRDCRRPLIRRPAPSSPPPIAAVQRSKTGGWRGRAMKSSYKLILAW